MATSAAIRIPTRVLDSVPTEFEFKSGAHRVTIEDVTKKDLPRSDSGEPFKGYETTDGYELGVKLGNIAYLEDESNAGYAGNRKKFFEIVVSDGDNTIYDVDQSVKQAPYWKLQSSQRLLIQIARALGQVEVDGEDTVIADGFLEAFEAGQFNGSEVGVNLNVKGKYANVTSFFTV